VIEKLRNYGIVFVFGLLFIVLSFASTSFLSPRNAANILDQSSILIIMATTATLCIIAGIFDLSIAAVATGSAIVTVHAVNNFGLGGMAGGLIFGGLLGFITGLAIISTNVSNFIGTLAASFTYRGLGLILAAGGLVTVDSASDAETMLGVFEGRIFGVKGAVYVSLTFALIVGIALSKTVWGKKVYAVGGNAQAAYLAGIRPNRILLSVYTIRRECFWWYGSDMAWNSGNSNLCTNWKWPKFTWCRYNISAHHLRSNDLCSGCSRSSV